MNSIDKHSALVRRMVAEGYNTQEILKELNKLGCKVSYPVLERWLKENNLKVDKPNLEPVEKAVKERVETTPKQFDFDQHFGDCFDAQEVTEFLQKAHYFLYKRQLEIVAAEQEEYYLGIKETQSINSLRQLQILAGLLYKIAPLHLISNQQEAIRIVQRMGYTVSFEGQTIDVDFETDTETGRE